MTSFDAVTLRGLCVLTPCVRPPQRRVASHPVPGGRRAVPVPVRRLGGDAGARRHVEPVRVPSRGSAGDGPGHHPATAALCQVSAADGRHSPADMVDAIYGESDGRRGMPKLFKHR